MENIRGFIPTIIAWLLLITIGYVFISSEMNRPVYSVIDTSTKITEANYDRTADLTELDGSQMIGMVQAALNGEYQLTIDGITIDSSTDISMIDLRGVPNHTYKITLYRQNGEIVSINAIH